MLRLKGITKNYKVAGGEIEVLKGLDIAFRKSEFVSILGPSGCGKTTTLNIVGGLDKYTSGDLIIAGKSTKNFTDRDWDIYRNQRIGFVFQSYNLIPHQTVLGNVELALTISGVSKEERIKRAMRALERVGLKGEENKRPNQLSGGQCQRVAIARALVNEPDILLADEPTGALDSKTSVQIMDLIKEISKDKLVIMVTHNSEIAESYSTRIVRLVDGEIVEDSNPYSEQDEFNEVEKLPDGEKNKKSKAKMSWWTAFKLSARNLLTKRKRTALTSIAGSIGIIGISAVIAVSTGVRTFIADMQDDMLSGNPITIKETSYDLDAIMGDMSFSEKVEFVKKQGYVNVDASMEQLAKSFDAMEKISVKNNITQEYVDYVLAMPKGLAAFKVDYGIDIRNNIYTDFKRDENVANDQTVSISAIKNIYTSVMKETEYAEQASLITQLGATFMQAPSDSDYIKTQYNVLTGKLAEKADELMIVVNKDRALTDLTLAQIGYYTQEEFLNIAYRAVNTKEEPNPNYNPDLDKKEFSYQELLGKTFTYYPNDVIFEQKTNLMNPFTYKHKVDSSFTDGMTFKIVGILETKENINFGCLKAGMYYTQALAEKIIAEEQANPSAISNYLNNFEKNNNGTPFTSTIIKQTNPTNPEETIEVPYGITYDYEYFYDDNPSDATIPALKTAKGFVGSTSFMSSMMGMMGGMMGSTSMGGSDYYTLSARNVGGVAVSNDISIYPSDFTMKDKVTEYLDAWNGDGDITVNGQILTAEDREEIKYTDTLSLIIDMIDSMIDVVTIALVAFTSLSLVVSCVMIAIITYVSVVERVKEIGVIRSLGGRKRDVSNLFNAETLVIGLASGLFGIGVTYVISLIVNLIVQSAAGFSIMLLPFTSALIMVGLSVGLTVLSGLIPSKKAAHQDPVVALRTE